MKRESKEGGRERVGRESSERAAHSRLIGLSDKRRRCAVRSAIRYGTYVPDRLLYAGSTDAESGSGMGKVWALADSALATL